MISEYKLSNGQKWIDVGNVNSKTIEELEEKYEVPNKFLKHINDIHTRPQILYDLESKIWLLIIRRVKNGKHKGLFQTWPVAFIFQSSAIIVVRAENGFGRDDIVQKVTDFLNQYNLKTMAMVVAGMLLQIADEFLTVLDEIDDEREKLEKFENHPNDKKINQIMQLDKSVLYLHTAANNNETIVKELQLMSKDKDDSFKLTSRESEHIEEAVMALEQVGQTAEMADGIMDRVTNAYNNVLNNNLNKTMWFLTVWSIVLMIPTIVSGFYGMNVKLPWAENLYSWIWTVFLSFVLIGAFLWILARYRNK